MKIEESESGPKLNLLKPEGVRNQQSAQNVTHVLLDGLGWTQIVEGSFHFYKTAGDKPVPFVQFDVPESPTGIADTDQHYRVEVFPTAIAGLSYPVPVDSDDE
jgi:hypothetical protein